MHPKCFRLGAVRKLRKHLGVSTYSLSAFKWHKSNIKNLLIESSEIVFIFLPAFYLIIWLMTSPKNSEKISILKIWQLVFFWNVKIYFGKFLLELFSLFCIVSIWYFDHLWRPWHTQKTIFASMNEYFNDKLRLFLTEVSFNTPEENQLSYFQSGYFLKIVWRCHEPYNQLKCR